MSRRFAMAGPVSGETLSYGGLILVHDDPDELGFLFPGVRQVELGPQTPDYDTMSIRQHPGMSKIEWPLQREDFR